MSIFSVIIHSSILYGYSSNLIAVSGLPFHQTLKLHFYIYIAKFFCSEILGDPDGTET